MNRTCFQINKTTNDTIDFLTNDVPKVNRSDVVRAAISDFKKRPKKERIKVLTEEFNITEKERLKKVIQRRKDKESKRA